MSKFAEGAEFFGERPPDLEGQARFPFDSDREGRRIGLELHKLLKKTSITLDNLEVISGDVRHRYCPGDGQKLNQHAHWLAGPEERSRNRAERLNENIRNLLRVARDAADFLRSIGLEDNA